MIVYDLRCATGHEFEGWFAGSDAFTTQCLAGQLLCPFCGETRVDRRVSPLRIGGARSDAAAADAKAADPVDGGRNALVRKLSDMQAELLKKSQWVGGRFAERARAMAEGDEPPTTIHGRATVTEAKALHDDGIAVMPLPFAVVPPEELN